jgi:hypothetical protein
LVFSSWEYQQYRSFFQAFWRTVAQHEIVFAFQLALCVREPSLLNQAKVGISGENSLMIFLAKKTPSQFAEHAIDLMRGRHNP